MYNSTLWIPLSVMVHTLFLRMVIFHFRFLLEKGADKNILTEDGERPLDLVEPSDFETIRVMLGNIQQTDSDQSDDETLEQNDVTSSVSG